MSTSKLVNQNLLTHGFFKSVIKANLIDRVTKDIDLYLESIDFATYSDKIHSHIPLLTNFFPDSVLESIKALLDSREITLENIELHYLPPSSSPIPLHQDNFYHAIQEGIGLKIFVPLCDMTKESGALIFADCYSSIGTLEHQPSNVDNFSSYIDQNLYKSLKTTETSYAYLIGDVSYHFLNSIHYSLGNTSSSPSKFLVFRFHSAYSHVSDLLLENYKKCYASHLQVIKKSKNT